MQAYKHDGSQALITVLTCLPGLHCNRVHCGIVAGPSTEQDQIPITYCCAATVANIARLQRQTAQGSGQNSLHACSCRNQASLNAGVLEMPMMSAGRSGAAAEVMEEPEDCLQGVSSC